MVEQNTQEWLEMRKNKIGASDAAVILGVSPYKTPYALWEEKLGLAPCQIKTPSMQRGLDLEDQARRELEKMTGISFCTEVKLHKDIPWMMASLDAVDADSKHIAEIKCPGKQDHDMAVSGKIPPKYFPQLQHQLEVCQLEVALYFSYNGSCGVIVKVLRDDRFIKKMLEKEKQFWNCMQDFVPPEMTEKDYKVQDSSHWNVAAKEWLEVNQKLKILEKQESQLKNILVSLSKNQNSIGSGVKLTRFVRRGNIDYSSIPELDDVELEKYRKSPSECYKIGAV